MKVVSIAASEDEVAAATRSRLNPVIRYQLHRLSEVSRPPVALPWPAQT